MNERFLLRDRVWTVAKAAAVAARRGVLLIVAVSLCLMFAPGALASEAATAPVRSAPVRIAISHVFAGEALQAENVALRTGSNTLSVSRAAYLLSGVSLVRADGTTVDASLDAAFIDATRKQGASPQHAARTSFDCGELPTGKYVGVRFSVGVPHALNHADPATFGPAHPLNPAVNNLHWNWQGGYVFFALEGRWVQGDDTLGGYVYHVAGDDLLTRVDVPGEFTVGDATTINLELDIAAILQSEYAIVLTADTATHSTHSGKGDALAPQLAANIAKSFRFLGTRSGTEPEAALQPSQQSIAAPPAGTTPYPFAAPKHFPQVLLPQDNPLTVEGVALGKRLFFDVQLSGNNAQSCASCHNPTRAFADDKPKGLGAYGDVGPRNTMPLFNLAWASDAGYTWDGRKARIRDQVLQPIEDAREMHQSLEATIAKLEADESYVQEFAKAFGSAGVNAQRLSLAVEQYLLTLVSSESKFDRVQQGKETFTPKEQRGLDLFMGEYDPARGQLGADCFHCHGGALFTNHQFVSNGLDKEPADAGRAGVTDRMIDAGRFKTPSLRNVAITGPYMHDGRFQTLMEVLEHYSTGVQPSAALDANLAKHMRANANIAGAEHHAGVNLSQADREALEAFLQTLTDDAFVQQHGE